MGFLDRVSKEVNTRRKQVQNAGSNAIRTVTSTPSTVRTAAENEAREYRSQLDQDVLAERQQQFDQGGALEKIGAATGVGADFLWDNPRASGQEALTGAASRATGASSEAALAKQAQSAYEGAGSAINKPFEGTGLEYGENSITTGFTDLMVRPVFEGSSRAITGIDPSTGEADQTATGGDVLEAAFLPVSAVGSAARVGSTAARGARAASRSTNMANPLTALRGLSRVARGADRTTDATRAASRADNLPSNFDEQMRGLQRTGTRSAPTRAESVTNRVSDLPALRRADNAAPQTSASSLPRTASEGAQQAQQASRSALNRVSDAADDIIDIGPARASTSASASASRSARSASRTADAARTARFTDRTSSTGAATSRLSGAASSLGASARRTLDSLSDTLSGSRRATRSGRAAGRADSVSDAAGRSNRARRAERAEDATDAAQTVDRAEDATTGSRISRTISNLGDNIGTRMRQATALGVAAVGGAAAYEALQQPDVIPVEGGYLRYQRDHFVDGEPAAAEYQVYTESHQMQGHIPVLGVDENGLVHYLTGDAESPRETISATSGEEFDEATLRGQQYDQRRGDR